MQRTYRDWDRFLSQLPGELNNVLSQIQNGKFDIQLAHHNLDPIINRLAWSLPSCQLRFFRALPFAGLILVDRLLRSGKSRKQTVLN